MDRPYMGVRRFSDALKKSDICICLRYSDDKRRRLWSTYMYKTIVDRCEEDPDFSVHLINLYTMYHHRSLLRPIWLICVIVFSQVQ